MESGHQECACSSSMLKLQQDRKNGENSKNSQIT